MPAGRPRKRSEAENKRLGNPGKRKVKGVATEHPDMGNLAEDPTDPPATFAPTSLPEPPDWLDDAARVVWDRVINDFGHTGFFAAADTSLLIEYCEWTAHAEQLQADLRKKGLYKKRSGGEPVQRAEVKICRETWDHARKCGKELGLTPPERKKAGLNLNDGSGGKKGSPGSGKLETGNAGPDNGIAITQSGILLTATKQWILGFTKDRSK